MDFNRVKLPREIHSGPGVIKETGSICKDLKIKGKLLVASGPHTMKIAEKSNKQPS
jgi:glycerol-1-phosphate dehydrogenase [NAD(P)+]